LYMPNTHAPRMVIGSHRLIVQMCRAAEKLASIVPNSEDC